MMVKAVQQFQLRNVLGSESKARETLSLMKAAGYEGIELNGFMIKKMPFIIRILTRFAGMPMGRSGHLDWKKLIADSGLSVVSVHEDLGSILKRTEEIIEEARAYKTEFVVVTGMHHFDYSDAQAVTELIEKLNRAGQQLKAGGIQFLYHNHNCEFRKVAPGKSAYDRIIAETDPEYVAFEFDSYWPTEAGVDALAYMERLGERMKLYHINDRGSRVQGPTGSILKSDSMELGYGNLNLPAMIDTAKKYGVKAIILETHKNWADKSPIKSFQMSAEYLNKYV